MIGMGVSFGGTINIFVSIIDNLGGASAVRAFNHFYLPLSIGMYYREGEHLRRERSSVGFSLSPSRQ
jgi:hypothetical protein